MHAVHHSNRLLTLSNYVPVVQCVVVDDDERCHIVLRHAIYNILKCRGLDSD